jgi:4'-phosphopantetheinyl transferase
MPLFTHHELPNLDRSYGVWQITESDSYFLDALAWPATDLAAFDAYKGHRKTEGIAARFMLHQLTRSETLWVIEKDGHSKPWFVDQPEWHCSLSHSHGMAAAILSKRACGIDLQRFTEKMDALAPKFVAVDEQAMIENLPVSLKSDAYHQIWTAKEAMYKVYGRKALDFKANMQVMGLTIDTVGAAAGLKINLLGRVEKHDEIIDCQLQLEWFVLNDQARYCLCVAYCIG